jgi:hypothetical protein
MARVPGGGLCGRVNAVLQAEEGRRDWPLRFYTPARLFSVDARAAFIAPDLQPLPIASTVTG